MCSFGCSFTLEELKRELGGGVVEVFAVVNHKVVEIWSYPIQHAQDMFLFLNGSLFE